MPYFRILLTIRHATCPCSLAPLFAAKPGFWYAFFPAKSTSAISYFSLQTSSAVFERSTRSSNGFWSSAANSKFAGIESACRSSTSASWLVLGAIVTVLRAGLRAEISISIVVRDDRRAVSDQQYIGMYRSSNCDTIVLEVFTSPWEESSSKKKWFQLRRTLRGVSL